ncbi:hypothetical protein LAZ67_X000847 [Cordylochernes scorpioides]|uniref:Mos1 transposase HTH domain-containing protein n=1 Tax=Cordylochernes scorpioides TaxID=51811 RepID=A0ABY6LRY2_9ARAC|nr:hypothetical protein LAZ67_X000847 [Cordylochernes scorpioides]
MADKERMVKSQLGIDNQTNISRPQQGALALFPPNLEIVIKKNFQRLSQETLALTNETYEDEKFSQTPVYFWYKRFKDGRKSIADDSRSGRPLTSTTDRNIGQVRALIVADRKITIDKISEILGISYDQQRETRLSICKDLIETANNDSDFLKTIITGLKMEYPVSKNKKFRHLLFFAFHQGQKAAEAARDICNVYGKGVIGERAAQKWFAKFKNGDLNLEDTPRSGRPSEFDEEHLKALLKEDGRQKTRELAEKMKCSAVTISNHLQSIDFSQKLGAWVPHELNETNK